MTCLQSGLPEDRRICERARYSLKGILLFSHLYHSRHQPRSYPYTIIAITCKLHTCGPMIRASRLLSVLLQQCKKNCIKKRNIILFIYFITIIPIQLHLSLQFVKKKNSNYHVNLFAFITLINIIS